MNVMSLYKSQDLNKTPLDMHSAKLIDNQFYKVPQNGPILIHFWATWCPVCKLEASNINFLSKHFNVLTIAVKSGNNQEIQKYLDEHGYKYKVINDASGAISSKFKISGFPTTFVYDKNKKLAFSEVGYTSTLGLALRMWWAAL
jgi:thiol-disulfide isomerase/thioredoxin